MFDRFLPKSENFLGVDISSSAVKLLELSHQKEGFRVESYAVRPLPQEAVVEHEIKDQSAVVESIKDVIGSSNTKSKSVAVCIPDSLSMTKVLTMSDTMSEDEIESQIYHDAQRHIPYPIDEVNLDFQILGPTEGQTGHVDVLLVASRSEYVTSRAEVIELAGLTPKVVDVESYAIERACQHIMGQLPDVSQKDNTIAVVDVGASVTQLIILENYETVFSREEVFGGAQLTRDIQRHYGLSYAEAGMAKKTGDLPEDYEEEILKPFKELAVLQVKRALQFYFSINQDAKIDAIVLVGGTPAIPGFSDSIETELEIPTIVANPFANMEVTSGIDKKRLMDDASALMTCAGLAMRGSSL